MNPKNSSYDLLFAITLIILVALLTHAPLIFQLGYYRDDWHVIWMGFTNGFKFIPTLFTIDRPFMGVLYALEYWVLGNAPINWQFYALFLHILGALGVFWLLRMLWPNNKFEITIAAVFFVIYPGFLQQPNANTFQNHLFGYTFAILSISLMVFAGKAKKRIFAVGIYIISIFFSLLYFWVYEYMIGLEGVRLLILWLIFSQEELIPRIKKTLLRFSIYLPGIVVFLFWRIFLFDSKRSATSADAIIRGIAGNPIRAFLTIGVETAKDWVETTILAWAVPFYNATKDAHLNSLASSIILALIILSLIWLYSFWLKKGGVSSKQEEISGFSSSEIRVGSLIVFFAVLPVVVAGRNVQLDSGFNRYTLQASLGVALFWVGLLFNYVRAPIRYIILACMISAGVITHFQNAVHFQELWQQQSSFWWQVSWRAPNFKPDTVLVTMLPKGYGFSEAYEIWGPANIIYYPEAQHPPISAQILNEETAPWLVRGINDTKITRGTILIEMDYKKLVLLSKTTMVSCLHIIDGQNPELRPNEDPLVRWIAPLSNIDYIDTTSPFKTPPSSIFGKEPLHTWCYYYQKASYARQTGNWKLVAQLGDEAEKLGYRPLDSSEWMPFLEAYATLGREKDARQLAKIIRDDKDLRYSLCLSLETPPHYPDPYAYDLVVELLCNSN